MVRGLLVTFALVALSPTMNVGSSRAIEQVLPDGPPMPFVDEGACPFEGCVYREWQVREEVRIRRERRAESPVAFTARKGERVTAITGVVITTRPGRVSFRAPFSVDSSSGKVDIKPGETLFLLTYQGEGFTKAWFKGTYYSDVDGTEFFNAACEDSPSRCTATIVERPRSDWWVQIKNAGGQIGWSNEPQKFDGKDALAQ